MLMDYIRRKRRRFMYPASIAVILVFFTHFYTKWIIAIELAATSSSLLSQHPKSHTSTNYNYNRNNYRPCIIQLWGAEALRKSESISAAGARLSLTMAHEFARKHNMAYHLYDCMGEGKTCGKAPAINDACYSQQCTHVLYIDAEVLLHDAYTDVVGHLAESYPNAVFMMGIDYYNTLKTPSMHNGKDRLYRTDSNSGMIQFSCTNRLSKRILAEWERLCRRFSPYKCDLEAATLMETLPQYQRMGAFVRDALILGQYSVVARHFPGDPGTDENYPIPNNPEYEKKKSEMASGLFKWVYAYWKTNHGTEMPETEKWRLDKETKENGWNWTGPAFKKCPLNEEDYVADLLYSLDLDNKQHPTLDRLE